jgi:hypothetical protein
MEVDARLKDFSAHQRHPDEELEKFEIFSGYVCELQKSSIF